MTNGIRQIFLQNNKASQTKHFVILIPGKLHQVCVFEGKKIFKLIVFPFEIVYNKIISNIVKINKWMNELLTRLNNSIMHSKYNSIQRHNAYQFNYNEFTKVK